MIVRKYLNDDDSGSARARADKMAEVILNYLQSCDIHGLGRVILQREQKNFHSHYLEIKVPFYDYLKTKRLLKMVGMGKDWLIF